MEEYAECTTYVNVNVCGVYTHVQIKQLLGDKINPMGLFLNSSDFASLMFQLKSIENTLLLLNDKSIKETPIDTSINPSTSTEKHEDTTVKPPRPSTRTKSKRKRKSVETVVKKLDDVIMKVYAKLLPIIIKDLIKTRCFGCMLNLEASVDTHDICNNRQLCIEQCFVEAMSLVDQTKVAELSNDVTVPKLDDLILDTEWCVNLKNILNSDDIYNI